MLSRWAWFVVGMVMGALLMQAAARFFEPDVVEAESRPVQELTYEGEVQRFLRSLDALFREEFGAVPIRQPELYLDPTTPGRVYVGDDCDPVRSFYESGQYYYLVPGTIPKRSSE